MDDGNGSLILLNDSQFSFLEKMIVSTNNPDDVIIGGINPDLTLNGSEIVNEEAQNDPTKSSNIGK
jgi:hypothetical protein